MKRSLSERILVEQPIGLRVWDLIDRGYSNRRIAEILECSEGDAAFVREIWGESSDNVSSHTEVRSAPAPHTRRLRRLHLELRSAREKLRRAQRADRDRY